MYFIIILFIKLNIDKKLMTKAVIRVKDKSKTGGIHTIQGKIKSAVRKKKLSVQVELLDNSAISIPVGLPKKELDAILSHVKIPYTIEYVQEGGEIVIEKGKVPADYGLLQGNVKRLSAEKGAEKLKSGQLEQRLGEETQSRLSIQAELDSARAKYKQIINARDFVTQNMLRGNATWNTFVNFYTDTLENASEIYDIPFEVLEKEVLTFSSLQEREDFQAIAKDLKNARAAKEAVKLNPLLKIDQYAQKVLNKAMKIEKRQDAISDVRRELGAQIGREQLWIVLSTEDKKTLLTLPYTFRENGEYHSLEHPLIESINQSLTDSKLEYTQQGVDGLLRYVIPGMESRSRTRTRLRNTISSTEDAFVKLCGERQVVGITG